MREIKFKLWLPEIKRMTYALSIYDWANGYEEITVGEKATWLQFTGLKDKNGKEIYEGDIVKWDDGSDGKYWRVAVVYWDENECIHCFKCVKNTLHELSTTDGYVFGANFMNRTKREAARELIKVGNIYENSELLK